MSGELDVDTQIPPYGRERRFQVERVYEAALGYWAIRESYGEGHVQEVKALEDFLEVTRLAFIAQCPHLLDDPENPGHPGKRWVPGEGDGTKPGTMKGGRLGQRLGRIMQQIAREKAMLGG